MGCYDSGIWYQLDLFPFLPSYRYPGVRHKKLGLLSVGLLLVLVMYVQSSLQAWIVDLPDVSSAQQDDPDWAPIQCPGVFVYFSGDSGVFYDPSYFSVEFLDRLIMNHGAGPFHTRSLGAAPCPVRPPKSLENGGKFVFAPVMCPNASLQTHARHDTAGNVTFEPGPVMLEGSYEQARYRFLQVSIRLCCDAPDSCAPHCKPWNVSWDMIHDVSFNVVVDFKASTLRPSHEPVQTSVRHVVPPFARGAKDTFLNKVLTTETQKFLPYVTPSLVPDIGYTQTYYKTLEPNNPTRYKLYFRLAGATYARQVKYKPFLELVGDWAATYTALFGLAGFAILTWKEKWFNKQIEGIDLRHLNVSDFDEVGRLRDSVSYYNKRAAMLYTRALDNVSTTARGGLKTSTTVTTFKRENEQPPSVARFNTGWVGMASHEHPAAMPPPPRREPPPTPTGVGVYGDEQGPPPQQHSRRLGPVGHRPRPRRLSVLSEDIDSVLGLQPILASRRLPMDSPAAVPRAGRPFALDAKPTGASDPPPTGSANDHDVVIAVYDDGDAAGATNSVGDTKGDSGAGSAQS